MENPLRVLMVHCPMAAVVTSQHASPCPIRVVRSTHRYPGGTTVQTGSETHVAPTAEYVMSIVTTPLCAKLGGWPEYGET